MGTGGLILWHYLGGLCCLLSVGFVACTMIFAGRRKKDRSRSLPLEIRQVPENEQESSSEERHVDPNGDSS